MVDGIVYFCNIDYGLSTIDNWLNEMIHQKHEIVRCERCQSPFECKANSFTKCQCTTVQLTLNETQYISERFDGCLCAKCLLDLQREYIAALER